MKQFDVPEFYCSPIIGKVKNIRKARDPRKKDFTPSVLDLGVMQIVLPRHFGFCYGVENAIEIAYKALNENPGKRIYLLSQMIHNQAVNADLTDRGIRFLMDTNGRQLISFDELSLEDVVIVPAFGTTLEIEQLLEARGLEIQTYNTTCPFVEKVWNRSAKLGDEAYTVVIHGKPTHEETRATFSHAQKSAPAIVVADQAETDILGAFILGQRDWSDFDRYFGGRYSVGFVPERDLMRVGVVNQTTMLASDTQGIADHLKRVMEEKFGAAEIRNHFADTRDTLCYATNDNQQATLALFDHPADLAIVVGGHNSSNTSHLVELCEQHMPTLFIQTEEDLLSADHARTFDIHQHEVVDRMGYLPTTDQPRIVVTSGASCPDSIVDRVIQLLIGFYPPGKGVKEALDEFEAAEQL